MRTHLAAALIALCLAHGNVVAAESSPTAALDTADTLRLSIDDAVRVALDQGVDMRLARSDLRFAEGRIREATAEAWPQITGSFDYTRQFDSVFRGAVDDTIFGPLLSNTSFGAENRWTLDVTATQLLYSRRVGAGVGAARAYRALTDAQRSETEAGVTLRVRQAYYGAAATGHLLAIAEFGRDQAQSHFQQVGAYRKQGTRAEYDLIRAQVEAMNAEPPVVAARNEWALALLDLKRLLGVPLERPIVLISPVRFDEGMVPVADLEGATPAKRAALVAAEADIEGRRRLLDVERAARWPELKLEGKVSQQAFPERGVPDVDQFRRNVEGTVRLDFPVFLGLRTFGAVQRARAEMHQAEVRRDRIVQEIDLEQARARQEAQRTLAVLVARRGTAQLAGRAHHLANVRYTNGLSTALEVSDARLQLLEAEGNEVLAARDYQIALAQLERALGRPLALTPRPIDQLTLVPSPPEPLSAGRRADTRTP